MVVSQLVVSTAYAKSLPLKNRTTPVTYTQALTLYKQKNYVDAFQAFLILTSSDYDNIKYNYYLGRSAFLTKHFHEAIGAFERILMAYPHNERAKLELGRLYYVRHDYAQSRRYFDEVLNSNAPLGVKNNIRIYLARMKSEQEKKSVHHNSAKVTLLGSLFFDSNLNDSPQSDQFQLPSGGVLSSPSDIGAWGSEQMLAINHRYDNPEKLGFSVKNDITLYNRSVPGQSDYNILYGSYMPALSWHKKAWTLDAALFLDDMNYGKTPYLMSYGVAPMISYMPTTTQLMSVQLKWLKRDYQSKAYQLRNSQFSQLTMSYQKTVGSLFAWYAQGVFENEQKDSRSAAVNVNYQAFSAKTGVNYLWLRAFNVSASAQYQKKNFSANNYVLKSLGFNQKQEDSMLSATFGVTKYFKKSLSAELKLNLIQNNSTIQLYKYQKSALTFNLIKRF